jgi:hypothetical protein
MRANGDRILLPQCLILHKQARESHQIVGDESQQWALRLQVPRLADIKVRDPAFEVAYGQVQTSHEGLQIIVTVLLARDHASEHRTDGLQLRGQFRRKLAAN